MKDLIEKAQAATLSAFERVYELVNEYPCEEVPDSYVAVKQLLSLAHDILIGNMETAYRSRFTWKEIKKFIEEEKS